MPWVFRGRSGTRGGSSAGKRDKVESGIVTEQFSHVGAAVCRQLTPERWPG